MLTLNGLKILLTISRPSVVAKETGEKERTIRRIRDGEVENPHMATIENLSKYYEEKAKEAGLIRQ